MHPQFDFIYSFDTYFKIFCRNAIEEILKDTQRGAVRAEVSGSWRPPTAKINSRLFNNTLIQTLQSNKRQNKMNKNQQNGTKNSA